MYALEYLHEKAFVLHITVALHFLIQIKLKSFEELNKIPVILLITVAIG